MGSNSVLAVICVISGLYKHLIYDSEALGESIVRFANEVYARQREEDEAQRNGSLPRQFWTDTGLDPPKVNNTTALAL
jgi:endoribonuclease Dicer